MWGGGNHANVSISAAHKAAVDSAGGELGKPAGRMVAVLAGKNQDKFSVEQLKAQLVAANPQVRGDVWYRWDVSQQSSQIAEGDGRKFYPARDENRDGVLERIFAPLRSGAAGLSRAAAASALATARDPAWSNSTRGLRWT